MKVRKSADKISILLSPEETAIISKKLGCKSIVEVIQTKFEKFLDKLSDILLRIDGIDIRENGEFTPPIVHCQIEEDGYMYMEFNNSVEMYEDMIAKLQRGPYKEPDHIEELFPDYEEPEEEPKEEPSHHTRIRRGYLYKMPSIKEAMDMAPMVKNGSLIKRRGNIYLFSVKKCLGLADGSINEQKGMETGEFITIIRHGEFLCTKIND